MLDGCTKTICSIEKQDAKYIFKDCNGTSIWDSDSNLIISQALCKKTKQYINDLAKIGENYEFLRQRLLKNDFNLSPYEINMCAVALARQKSSFTNNIITLNKGIEIINSIGKILAGEEFEYLLDK